MAEPFIGQIQAFGFDFAPIGWAKCNGQLIPISSNSALFSLLGTAYGGDGRTDFALPDLRGRSMVHMGDGPGLSSIQIGQRGGAESVTITVNQMPPHNHTATLHGETTLGDKPNPNNKMLAFTSTNIYAKADPTKDNKTMAPESIVVQNSGGGQPLYIRNPFLGVNICIATVGIFPERD